MTILAHYSLDELTKQGNAKDAPMPHHLADALCSDDGKERAWAYQCIYDYHGWDNGDSCPSTLTRAEVIARYTDGELA